MTENIDKEIAELQAKINDLNSKKEDKYRENESIFYKDYFKMLGEEISKSIKLKTPIDPYLFETDRFDYKGFLKDIYSHLPEGIYMEWDEESYDSY